jgi:hypothetical protein
MPPNLFHRALVALLLCMLATPQSQGYSLLTHEQIVDLEWRGTIVPMLLARYPTLTAEQLKQAHSYAYGGCVLQDMGYYPFGSHYFSNLLHYVRTGDFVANLLRDSSTPDEYAFALGALAHYAGDTTGHPAVNQVEALQYPRLAAKYGDRLTYADDPTVHIRVEFGFDVAEVAKGRYQEDDYRSFIGFNVSKPLIEQAFVQTYGVPLNSVLHNEDRNISSYRYDVSTLIPKMTRVAWASYGKDIQKAQPTASLRTFRYKMRKVDYEKQFGSGYRRPGLGARLLAVIVRILPKIGPLKALQVKMPNAQQQNILLASVNQTDDVYHRLLQQVAANYQADPKNGFATLQFPEMDFDTGRPTQQGEYQLSDQTYAQLLVQVTRPDASAIPDSLRQNLLEYYSTPSDTDYVPHKMPRQWAKVQAGLAKLKAEPAGEAAQAVAAAAE